MFVLRLLEKKHKTHKDLPQIITIKGKDEITCTVGFLVCKTRGSNSVAEFCLDKWCLSLIAGLFAPPQHQSSQF